jgi:hypothetical protein
MTQFNNFADATELCSYLTRTLIPDLRESGSDATADDFADCVAHIEHLQAEADRDVLEL